MIYQVPLTWALLLLPVWVGMMVMLGTALGLILSSLAVYYRDVKHVLPVFVQMLLYISPVAYAVSEVPAEYRNSLLSESAGRAFGGFSLVVVGNASASNGISGVFQRTGGVRPDVCRLVLQTTRKGFC